MKYPHKKKLTAVGLWLVGLLGYLNFHNFYLGHWRRALGKLIGFIASSVYIDNSSDTTTPAHVFFAMVFVGLFIWNAVDLIRIIYLPGSEFGKSPRPKDYSPEDEVQKNQAAPTTESVAGTKAVLPQEPPIESRSP